MPMDLEWESLGMAVGCPYIFGQIVDLLSVMYTFGVIKNTFVSNTEGKAFTIQDGQVCQASSLQTL